MFANGSAFGQIAALRRIGGAPPLTQAYGAGMGSELVESIRTRAELARRLSTEIKDPAAAATLREIADTLDAEADKLEQNVEPIRQQIPPAAD
jgi:hypothetical protein